MDTATRKNNKIETLPNSLENAIELFEQSALAKETLGDHIFEKLIENKKLEWDQYRITVTKYEQERYLSQL